MKRTFAVSTVLLLNTASLIGCDQPSSTPDAGWDGLVRDSAGITIVENSGPLWKEGEEWRLSPEPLVSIGGVEAPEEYLFTDVRGAFLLGTGKIVVADMMSHQVRWFDSQGGFVRAVGREGGGPEEFQTILRMWRTSQDSLAIWDYGNGRISMLGPEGNLGRLFRQQAAVLGRPSGLFGDGSFLAQKNVAEEGATPEGLHRRSVIFFRWTPSGELAATLPERPGQIRYHELLNDRHLQTAPPYTSPTGFTVATAKDRWYYNSLDRYEIEEYSPDGELLRLIRRDIPPQPVTPELVEEYREFANEYLAPLPTWGREWRLSLPMPDHLPPHGDFVVDDGGHLWVAEYSLEGEPKAWSVFDPQGRFLGTVQIPPGGTLTQIGADFVLGVWKDEMDVEEVRMYGLTRGG